MGKQRSQFTREMWRYIQKRQVLGTWRYSKGIYSVHPALLNALTEISITDSLPMDVFLQLPEWCIYVRTPGMIMDGEPLYGFWSMVSQDIKNGRNLYLLLNGQDGIRTELFALKTGSIKAFQEKMFSDGLGSSGMTPDVIESLKKSGYITDYLKRKLDYIISKLLSILLFICSDEPEIDSECQPGTYPTRPKLVKTKKGFRLLPANGLGTGLSVRIRSGIR
ncbi:hypothetical protein ACFXK6_003144 [Citrobacter koseri]|uniref:hypothetical protein n=1 Tax=Citrobacter koseri TaxID=545 RepID=UPI001B9D8BD4|nr:hypothetical protein [Citrobacter koseri]EKU0540648.1 hypothetical protein [Citrobacter koseri]EKU8895590.1 hypothetical protein [Citrobacter koseri]MDT7449586.1 hypothetical protein [Citrobacter koseri]HBC9086321.1 hypothetical protein [Citrobacter koseri]HEM6797750.1 hypothetical protein [Citrobacter koseri]